MSSYMGQVDNFSMMKICKVLYFEYLNKICRGDNKIENSSIWLKFLARAYKEAKAVGDSHYI